MLRRRVVGAPRVAAISGAAWGGIGWLDWFVYSFGYSLASWTHRDTTAIGEVLEWFRVPIVALIALALAGAARGAPDRNRGS